MSLWKCATHSSLGNFSCTDEGEGERCGDANSVEMARRLLRHPGPIARRPGLMGLTPQLDSFNLIREHDVTHEKLFCVCSILGVWGSRFSTAETSASLIIHWICLFLSTGGQRVCVWIDSRGQNTVTTQWTATKELISNQLPTCFCPAPFICFECRASWQFNVTHSHTRSHTHHLLSTCVCLWGFLLNSNYSINLWGNPVIQGSMGALQCEKCIQRGAFCESSHAIVASCLTAVGR